MNFNVMAHLASVKVSNAKEVILKQAPMLHISYVLRRKSGFQLMGFPLGSWHDSFFLRTINVDDNLSKTLATSSTLSPSGRQFRGHSVCKSEASPWKLGMLIPGILCPG